MSSLQSGCYRCIQPRGTTGELVAPPIESQVCDSRKCGRHTGKQCKIKKQKNIIEKLPPHEVFDLSAANYLQTTIFHIARKSLHNQVSY